MRLVVMLALLALATAPAFAHTGPLVGGEPAIQELEIGADPVTTLHDETIDNPMNAFKGWWWVNLTNFGPNAWAGVTITPGVGNLVALVQGNNLPDEWGFVGNSVLVNRAATPAYSGYIGDRTYENGAYGLLWGQCAFTFATPVSVGQKIGLRIYTDNSYYQGPYATSFSVTITPNPVPEPSSLLALSGMFGLAGLAWRRRR